ncbi:hypothetical protein B0H15DRAFT_942389 [Mycena belliarum]|uniref:Uncharacterized protein n=1 Tax=Mycena belliarum TaxID=1033014 RepID=A0AAD6UJ12_9AGAR|nr:hypothetical protein B0H15DRAFT_942389 [Mycena belliae]
MKTGSTLVLTAHFLALVARTPFVNAGLDKAVISQWDAERQAVALLDSKFAAQGQGVASARPGDIMRLKSQWKSRLSAERLLGPVWDLDTEEFIRKIRRPQYTTQQGVTSQAPLEASSRLANAKLGYISVHSGGPNGPFLGFLDADKIVPTRTAATKYAIAAPHLSATQIDVADAPLRMCVAVGPLGESLGRNKAAFHSARHIPTGAPDTGPRWSPTLNTFVMTSVFALDPASREITVHWTNPNGDMPRTVIALARERVFFTGDASAFAEDAEVVAFNWVEFRNDAW